MIMDKIYNQLANKYFIIIQLIKNVVNNKKNIKVNTNDKLLF